MVDVATLQVVFSGNTAGFDAAAAGVESRLSSMVGSVGTRLTEIGGQMTRMGSQLTLAFAPVGLAIGGALAASIKFEDAFAGVRKTVDASPAQFDALADSIREMATSPDSFTSSMKDAHTQLSRIMELGGQMGVPIEKLDEFAEVIAALEISTDLTAESAATMMGQFIAITDMDVSNVDKLGSVIVDLGNNFSATETQIAEMMLRIAGAGKVVGIPEKDIAAIATALSSVGINAEAGGTAISRAILDINDAVAKGGDKLSTFAEVAGMTRDEFAQSWSTAPADTLDAFVDGLRDMNESGGDVIGTLDKLGLNDIRVRDALLRMATGQDVLSAALDRADTAWDENTALVEEAGKRAETTQGGINQVRNKVNDLGITLGDILKPQLDMLLEKLGPIITDIQEWAEANPGLVTGLAGVGVALAVAGPLLFAVGIAASGLGVIVAGLGVAFGLVISPVGLAIAAVIAGVILLKGYIEEHFGSIGEFLTQLKDNFVAAFEIITGKIGDAIGLIGDFVTAVIGAVEDFGALIGVVDANRGLSHEPGALTEAMAGRGPGHQGGTSWTGSGPADEVAGFVHNQEAVVPSGGMLVKPSPSGLMLSGAMAGGGGGDVVIQTVNVYASSEDEGRAAARGFEAEIHELWRRGA